MHKGWLLRLGLVALALIPLSVLAPAAWADHSSLQLVSAGASGGAGSYTDFYTASQDNSVVIFGTTDQLVPADTDNQVDIYKRVGTTTTLVSTGPNGGNGAFPASFGGASQDGSRIFFMTEEQLVASDTDSSLDVYEYNNGTTILISSGPTGGNGAYDAYFVGNSTDGTRRFFQTSEQLTAADTDNQQDVYMRSGVTTTLMSTGPAGGNGNFPAAFRGASADGIHVFFETNEQLTSADTDSSQDVYERSSGVTTLLSTGSTGGNGAFNATFEGNSTDGSRVFFTTEESLVSADTDTNSPDVYQRSGGTTTLLSIGTQSNANQRVTFVGSSADGSHVFFETQDKLLAADNDGFIDVYDRTSSGTTLVTPGGTDNQGATNAYFVGSSSDGSIVFFRTDESLTGADTDGYQDIYQRSGGTTTLVSVGVTGGNAAVNVNFGGNSPDGSDVIFETTESLVSGDTDTNYDVYERTNGTTTLLSQGGNSAFDARFAGISPDAQRVFFRTNESLLGSDGDTAEDLYSADVPGKVVVVKDAQPDDPQDFTFAIGGGLSLGLGFPPGQTTFALDDDADPTLSNTQTMSNVAPGAGYSVAETVPSGWDQTSAACNDGSPVSNIDVSPGETVTCTFTNRKRGKIVLVEDSQPDDPQDFSFTAGGGLSPSSFSLDDDADGTLSNTQTFNSIVPGSGYSLSESVPAGWDQTGATCSDGSPISNIDVSAGETVTCTVTNRKRGKVVVVEDSQPDDPQDFSFTAGGGLSPSSFSLDDDADGTLSNTQNFNNVVPGSGYSLSESVPAGWDQSSATCSDGSPISNIDVSAGETVTCTVTNRKRGKLILVEDSQPDDPQDFAFIAGNGLNPGSFSLDDDTDPTLSNTQTFNNVTPAAGYSFSETVPNGWDQTGATCDDGSPISNIGVSAGETVTCTVTNRKRGKVVVVEDSQPNDAQDFSFAAGGGLSPSSFSLDDDSDGTLSNTQTFNNVVPGSGYSVSETVPSGWDLSTSTCDNGNPVTSISVSNGQTVTCTFTNKKRGSLAVVKDANPFNDQQVFTFSASGGLSPTSFQLDDNNNPQRSNTQNFSNLQAGSGYAVSETVPSGWTQSSATCSNGSPVSNITIGPGEAVTCTFVNDKLARITVVKDAQPDDPQDFNFTADGTGPTSLSPSSFALDDDTDPTLSNTQVFSNLLPGGGYSISEGAVPAAWLQSSATCSDGSPVTNINLTPGEQVTCTFVNKKKGSITVVKDAQPNDPQDFSFTAGGGLSPSSFSLDDDSDPTLSNTRTFSSLTPASGYSLAETVPSGWDQSSATCNDGSLISNITVDPGENITCTFTNKKRGSIVVVKDAQPDDSQDFSFSTAGGLSPSSFSLDDDSDPTLSNTHTFSNVPAASGYALSESVPSGWDQSSATCNDGSPVTNITVDPGETVTCTFTNRKRGTIVAVKDAQPNDPQDFSFSAGGGLSPSSFSLDDDSDPTLSNTHSFSNVTPGSGYSLSESVPSGWDQTGATCDDGSPVSNIDVAPGETVTCTFTNRKRGSLTIVKQAQPNDPQDFSFTAGGGLSPSSFSLDDDSDPTLSNTKTYSNVTPGSYSVSESVPSGWDQTGATCDDGSPVSSIDIAAGEDVTCTFTNRKRGTIIVAKDAQPDDPQDFSFSAGGGLSPSSFALDDDSDPTLSNTRTFSNVTPGSGYSVSESVPSGWDQSSASCDDGSPISNIDVSAGETVTCSFTNVKRGSVTVVKDAQPNDPQDFDFTAGGGLSPSSFSLDDDSNPTLSNTRTFNNVQPGSGYSLDETVPSGWVQSSATCDDGSPIDNIDVSAGEHVTCTFTNSKGGSITVVKDAQPNDPQDFDFTAGGGLSPSSFSLDDDSDPTLSNSQTFTGVTPGSGYSVAESVPAGWDQSSATCDDGSPVTNITMTPGEAITCTFTNKKRGQLVVVKDALPDDPADFSFTAGGGLSPSSFQLDDDSDPTLSNTQTFDDVPAGSGYSISESSPSPWFQTSADCDNGSQATNITIDPGQTVTCTFVNSHGFPRPKGATPYRASLAIAYQDCTSPNRAHGAPLITPSCNPPVQSSNYLTVGTLDANGVAPNFVGRLRLDVKNGNANTPANEADIEILFDTSDIRKKSDLSDYTGELSAGFDFQLTDRSNGTSQTEPGTALAMPFSMSAPCAATSSTTTGSTCTVNTTMNALIPNAVIENKRAIWQLSNIRVFDGGADGDASTTGDNTLFARQGIFVP